VTPTLSSFAGLANDGTWTLHIRDVAALDTGHLQAWSLRLST
jgi:subtilisin-like proprotein convertase family protein